MRALVALAALLFACADSWADFADAPKRTMPHQKECAVPLPTDFWDDSAAEPFQRAEAWAWNERICLGHWADMRDAPGGSGNGEECESAEIEKTGEEAVPTNRELRPEFLELVLSHEPWASSPRHPQVGIKCALVRGDINLDDHEITLAFSFHKGEIDGKVSLLGTKFKRTLALSGSTVTGKLDADRLVVGGGLFLRDAKFKDIDLISARIAGEVAFNGSTVTGKLDADRLVVGGGLFLRDAKFKDIDLLSARTVGGVTFNGSTVTGKLDADRLVVGGGLFLRDTKFKDIDLISARIADEVAFNGSTVTGKLDADRLVVGGGLFLRDAKFKHIDLISARITGEVAFNGSTVTGKLGAGRLVVGDALFLRNAEFKDIDLLGAKIGDDVFLNGSTYSGVFDLTGSAIGGELHFSSGWIKSPPIWQNGASLILRNVKAEALQARKIDWNISGGDGLLPTDLTGFTFNRLGGLNTSGGTGMGDELVDWLIGWIKAQRDHGQNYDPQPYTQLAQVLETAGANDKAKAVRYAKFEHKHDHDISMSPIRRAVHTIERYFLGYGVYPFRALYWFVGLVVLGGLLAQCSKEPSVRRWMGLWYSLENALPLIETNERFKNVEHDRPWLAHFFHFQKAVGFLIATVLVGALTLLSS